jgi:hypothetical protein
LSYSWTTINGSVTPAKAFYTAPGTNDITGLERMETTVSLFPNPVNNVLNVSFIPDKKIILRIALADMAGREVLSIPEMEYMPLHNRIQLDVTQQTQGLYFLLLQPQSGRRITRKIEIIK